VSMVIPLVTLIEPQILKPFVSTSRVIKAFDLPELTDSYLHAYAEEASDQGSGNRR
jgi:hypothetical protein